MFDYYQINPPVSCFVCSYQMTQWQGKHGPCLLLVWAAGKIAPIAHQADSENCFPVERLEQERLPEQFEIYPVKVNCRECPTSAMGECVDGRWVTTTIYYPGNKQIKLSWQDNYADHEKDYWAQ